MKIKDIPELILDKIAFDPTWVHEGIPPKSKGGSIINCKQFYAGGQGKGSAAKYFCDHLSSSCYYLSGAGLLQGSAFEHMQLSKREVDLKAFMALEANKHPETGKRITPRTNTTKDVLGLDQSGNKVIKTVTNRKSGFDITLATAKTMSMAIAENDNEFGRMLEKICVRAKDEAMAWAETQAMVSESGKGPFVERCTGNLLWLSVVHQTARASGNNVPDPYWHTHSYCFPQTWDSARFRSVSMSRVLRFSQTIDAIFVSSIAGQLAAIGVGTERSSDGKSFELTSVQGREVFCKRTQEITGQYKREQALVDTIARCKVKEAAARGTHLDFEKARQQVRNGRSRASDVVKKKKPIEKDEQLAAWRAQMTPAIRASLNPEALLAGDRRNWRTPNEAKQEVLYTAFKQDSVVHEYDVVAELLRATGGAMTFQEALQYARGPAFIHLDNDGHLTTDRVRQEERDMLRRTRSAWDTRAPMVGDRPIADVRVANAPDQAAAVRFIWNSRDGVMDVSGLAGAGKSSLLREAVPAIKAAGHHVVLLAPTSASEKNLQEDFPETITVQKFENDLETVAGLGKNLVIFLDESSMVSVPQMAKMVNLVHSQGCRLVTLGDVDQHRSYARGDAIRILQESGSVRSAQLTETYRAKVAYLKESVLDLKAGGVRREIGYNRLDEHGDIAELEDVDKMRQAALQTHLEAVRKGELAIMASPTHSEAHAVAEMVRQQLKSEGRIALQDHVVTRLISLDADGPQLRDPIYYQIGRVIGFHSPKIKGGFKSGEKWQIAGREQDGCLTVTRNGETKSFNPSSRGSWRIYDTAEMVLSVGDQVRINEGFKQRHTKFKNNELAKIAAIDEQQITLDDGRSMPRDYVHLDQGVCITSYAAECRTVKQIVSLVPCASLPALDAKTFYVLASRATHRAVFYTDCKEALKEAALREGDRPAVWDYEKKPFKAGIGKLMAQIGMGRQPERAMAYER